ncbi:MAG: helix-turn-helix domain-containing protein [Oscillospiraceae bacterium]|nr:helix-turn-helix domain-containing protein [Oscillospiraceae bacterium]
MTINPMTGEELRRIEYVATLGLSSAECAQVERVLPTKDCQLLPIENRTELYVYPCIAIIIRGGALDAEQLNELEDYFREYDYVVAETVVWIGEPKPSGKLGRIVKSYDSFEALLGGLKYLLLSAHKTAKGLHDFSSKIALAIRMLKLIEQRPGITSDKLAEELEISRRSVQRYIETMRMAGEWVEYDASLRGWKLVSNQSLLLDDF